MSNSYHARYKRNITIINWLSFLRWGRFVVPIEALFHIAGGLTFAEYVTIHGIYMIMIFLLEVPSGAFADLVGRKYSLIIAKIAELGQTITYIFAYNVPTFLLARFFIAISNSFHSGADSALQYDSAKKLGQESEFKKINSHQHFMRHLGVVILFPLGSVFFHISEKLPAYASIPVTIINLILVFMLTDIVASKEKYSMVSHYKQIVTGFNFCLHNKYVKFLLVYIAGIFASLIVVHSASSLYAEAVGIPLLYIGAAASVAALASAITSKFSHKIEEKLTEKWSLALAAFLFIAIVFGHFYTWHIYGILLAIFAGALAGFLDVIIENYIHSRIDSSHRATVLSIKAQIITIAAGLLFLVSGWINNIYSFEYTYLLIGSFSLLVTLLAWGYAIRNKTLATHYKL